MTKREKRVGKAKLDGKKKQRKVDQTKLIYREKWWTKK